MSLVVFGDNLAQKLFKTYLSAADINIEADDLDRHLEDLVAITTRRLVYDWSFTIFIWTICIIALQIQGLFLGQGENYPDWTIIIFILMWLSSIGQIRCCIDHTKKLMRCPGHKFRPLPKGVLGELIDGTVFAGEFCVQYDSKQLHRKIILYTLLSILYTGLALLSQSLAYFWLVTGSVGMWTALGPALLVAVIFLVYAAVVKTVSITALILYSGACISLCLIGMQTVGQISLPWVATIAPLLCTEVYLAWHLFDVHSMVSQEKVILSQSQQNILYIVAVVDLACIIATVDKAIRGDDGDNATNIFIAMAAMVGLFTVITAGLKVFASTCSRVAQTRGHSNPASLTYDDAAEGFERVMAYGDMEISPVLGLMELKLPIQEQSELYGADESTPLAGSSRENSYGGPAGDAANVKV